MNESLEQQCNEFDLRETKARNALSAAGVPDWEPYPNEDVSDHEKSLRSGGRALSVVDRIERLARDLKHARDDEAFAAEHADNCDIRNASMEQQLAAATNDAARAELRARDLTTALKAVADDLAVLETSAHPDACDACLKHANDCIEATLATEAAHG